MKSSVPALVSPPHPKELSPSEFYRQLHAAAQARVNESVAADSAKSALRSRATDASVDIDDLKPVVEPLDVLINAIAGARVVLLSQYQTLPECRLALAELIVALKKTLSKPIPLAVALDCLSSDNQMLLDGFAAGQMTLAQLDKATGISEQHGQRYWQSLQPLLQLALDSTTPLKLLAADAAALTRELTARDAVTTKTVETWLKANSTGICFVPAGELRLKSGKLYGALKKHKVTIVLQTWDEIYWWWLDQKKSKVDLQQLDNRCLRWGDNLFSINHLPPLLKLDSYLTWSVGQESWPGWPPTMVVEKIGKIIHKSLRLPESDTVTQPLQVYCCGDIGLLRRIQKLDGLTEEEGSALLTQMAAFESLYLPRPNVIYLATLDGYHLGEEIGHSIRINLTGEVGQAARWSKAGWLYYNSINEAAGYLASKIVTPGRKTDRKSLRACERLAAAAEIDPETMEAQFDRLSQNDIMVLGHRAGYGLGELLYRSLQGGSSRKRRRLARQAADGTTNDSVNAALTPQALHPLFTQPVASEEEAKRIYLELFALAQRKPLQMHRTLHERIHWVGLFYFLFFFMPALIWGEARNLWRFPKPLTLHWQHDLFLALGCAAVMIGVSTLLNRYFAPFKKLSAQLVTFLGALSLEEMFLLSMFSAVGEEFLFRGVLQAEFGLVASSLLFALLHFVPDRRFYPWPAFAFVAGLVFGGIYQLSGNLFVPVIAHFLINFANIVTLLKKKTP